MKIDPVNVFVKQRLGHSFYRHSLSAESPAVGDRRYKWARAAFLQNVNPGLG